MVLISLHGGWWKLTCATYLQTPQREPSECCKMTMQALLGTDVAARLQTRKG